MARISRNNCIVFQPGAFIIISLALLMIPARWVVGWFVAVFVHELCHYIALCICKVPVLQIRIGAFGTAIQTGEMTTRREIVAALAGPLGSLILLFFFQIIPYVSLCALWQLLFNMIPIYPMEGGRAVTGICVYILGKEKGFFISKIISLLFVILFCAASLLISLRYKLGIMPVLIAALIVFRTIKIPCKERQLIVQ